MIGLMASLYRHALLLLPCLLIPIVSTFCQIQTETDTAPNNRHLLIQPNMVDRMTELESATSDRDRLFAQLSEEKSHPQPVPEVQEKTDEASTSNKEQSVETTTHKTEDEQKTYRGNAIVLGGGIVGSTLSLRRDSQFSDGTTPYANMTDNGRPNWLLNYQTGEFYLLELPLRVGDFRLGYNSIVKVSSFQFTKQTMRDVTVGEDLGTSASGTFFGIAPELFMLLGPLYKDSSIFWKAGLGIGIGLIDFNADILFRNSASEQTSRQSVSVRPDHLNPFFHIFWIVEWENLLVNYQLYQMEGNTEVGYFVFLETSLSLGYKFQF